MVGIGLVIVNLLLDGFTNTAQSLVYKRDRNVSQWKMMEMMNLWAIILSLIYLGTGYLLYSETSEIIQVFIVFLFQE